MGGTQDPVVNKVKVIKHSEVLAFSIDKSFFKFSPPSHPV